MKYYIHSVLGAKHFPESSKPAGMLILDLTGLLDLDKNRIIVLLSYFCPFDTYSVGTVEMMTENNMGKRDKHE